MARMHHGGLPTAALHGCSPLPYHFDTRDLNFLPKIWSKSMDHSPDPFEDAFKRLITTVPPSITTTHHDGGLPSSLSCRLSDNDPLLPPTPTQCSRQNLRERRLFWNNGWTKWEAVQLADKFKTKQEMEKADWECRKKLEQQFEQIHGPFFFDLDEDYHDNLQDKRIRQRWNVNLLQIAKEMVISSSPSSPK